MRINNGLETKIPFKPLRIRRRATVVMVRKRVDSNVQANAQASNPLTIHLNIGGFCGFFSNNNMMRLAILLICVQVALGATNNSRPVFVRETLETESVLSDPDDPAIWIHPTQANLSLIICTDKKDITGRVYVFDINGKTLQFIENLDRPNNVDVEYGFRINATTTIDIAVVTERAQKRLKIYRIDRTTRRLEEILNGNTSVFTNSTGDQALPMGIGLYKRPSDERIFAIVSRKSGPKTGYIGQYELVWNGRGIDTKLVRFFGNFQGTEIESIVVDDPLGVVYYSDERSGIRKYNVDPDNKQTEQIGFINTTLMWQADSEGLAIYPTSNTTGYLLVTDQIANGSIFHIYERQGNNSYLKGILTRADSTDGIEVTNVPLNDRFPRGLLVVMNEITKNFLIFDWRNIQKELDFIPSKGHRDAMNFVVALLATCLYFLRHV